MSYLSDFERSFSHHTLRLVEEYSGEFDATLLVNCLLGLLVVPKETFLMAIPEDPISNLRHWGVNPTGIRSPGRGTKSDPHRATLRSLVTNLRHSVAHFRIKPVPAAGDVHSFEFTNNWGLEAEIPIVELREFVTRLSKHLSEQ